MSIKDELLKYFSQFTGDTGGYGLNAKPQEQLGVDSVLGQPAPQTGNFGQLNPQMQPIGTGGVNQLNTLTDSMSNPIDATKSLNAVASAAAPNKGASDMGKQLIAKSIGSMGGGMVSQPQLKMINAQQAFAQMPDATQPQQIQEFKPEQMAQMLRKRNGNF